MQETGRVRRPSDEVPALIFLIFDIILLLFLEVNWLIIKPGTTARTFGPSQLWPRVRNVEGEAEVVVAAAKLLLRRDENNNSRAFIQEKAECF